MSAPLVARSFSRSGGKNALPHFGDTFNFSKYVSLNPASTLYPPPPPPPKIYLYV